MNLQGITMPRHEARAAFLEYRRAVRERHSAEDEALMRGYRALAAGRQVVNLAETIRVGGVDEKGMPKLAALRAHERWCFVFRERTTASFSAVDSAHWRHRGRRIRLPDGTLPATDHWTSWSPAYRCQVPLVPPSLRPADALSNYLILWEATWEKIPVPPGDPALLKPIGSGLYAVVATWDLTPLERMVLGMRREERGA